MPQPIFFLSFANHTKRPLPNLKLESDYIYRVLTPAANQQQIQIHRENFATIDKVAHYLMQYNNRVAVFHYGGHANSQQLIFEKESVHANGIALQLAKQESLKLVFLNGCSTHEQVKYLLELGIPAVIATSTSVDDSTSSEFAQKFYSAIASDFTIKKAFEMAGAILKTKTNQLIPRIYRDTILRSLPSSSDLPWGLYVKNDSVLDDLLIPPLKNNHKEKNVLRDAELDIDGDIHIGDKCANKDNIDFNRKNVIEGSKVKSKKDFRLGDG